jgi:signal peptidase I
MVPTLLVGDYLFVSKYSYGYSKHSLPWSLPLFEGRIFETKPERGDVAVFKLPSDGKTDYVKRIIGLPGDRIQMKDGILNINGKPVERRFVDDYVYASNGRTWRLKRYIETLPNGREHMILEESDSAMNDNTQVYTVPAGHYFAMGDNRDNSQDSRVMSAVGYVPAENLVGRAEIIFFSYGSGIRFGRIFDIIR